jgi:UDP-glucose 4-epimerase
MHFASFIQAGESCTRPGAYYLNNVANTLQLLDAIVQRGVKRFVFSSSAAVYGEPETTPIDEAHPCRPINPYGRTKWLIEQALPDFHAAHGLNAVSLRYFNAAGADPGGRLGESHDPETHLIPLVLEVAAGLRPAITVYGTDYDTPDGTCIRDYVHVADLCDAHLLALRQMDARPGVRAYNLGNGNGFSVREVIAAARDVTGHPIPVVAAPRRPGDPARLVADAVKACAELGWSPRRDELRVIIADAWRWMQFQELSRTPAAASAPRRSPLTTPHSHSALP